MKKHAHKNRAECFFLLPSWWRRGNENLLEKFCRCFVRSLKNIFSVLHCSNIEKCLLITSPTPLPKTGDCSHSELWLEQLFFARFFFCSGILRQEEWKLRSRAILRLTFSSFQCNVPFRTSVKKKNLKSKVIFESSFLLCAETRGENNSGMYANFGDCSRNYSATSWNNFLSHFYVNFRRNVVHHTEMMNLSVDDVGSQKFMESGMLGLL